MWLSKPVGVQRACGGGGGERRARQGGNQVMCDGQLMSGMNNTIGKA